MKLASFALGEHQRIGVVTGDVLAALPEGCEALDALLESPSWIESAVRRTDLTVPLASARLLNPLPAPSSIRDFMTFERHVEGAALMAGDVGRPPEQWYRAPAFYFTSTAVLHGPTDDVAVPADSQLFDLELEVAAVISNGGSDLTVEHAQKAIAGYVLMNDWSARDIQFAEMSVRLGPSKGKDGATSLGPYIVSADEMHEHAVGSSFDVPLVASINGRPIGQDNLTSMAFTFGQMISYASRSSVVSVGDLFGSGTAGGGCLAELWGRQGLDAHPPLRPGDVVTLDAGILGRQTTRVIAGTPSLEAGLFTAYSDRTPSRRS